MRVRKQEPIAGEFAENIFRRNHIYIYIYMPTGRKNRERERERGREGGENIARRL